MRGLAAVGLLAFVSGCGGGSSGSTPTPNQVSVTLSWTGITRSTNPQQGEPIELGVLGSPGSIQERDVAATKAQLFATVTPQSAGPVNVKIADTTIATVGTFGSAQFVHAHDKAGATLLTASVRSGVNAQLPVLVYPRFALACSAGSQPPDSAVAYAFGSGEPVAVSSPGAADLYLLGPDCPGAFHNAQSALIVVPREIELIYRPIPFSEVPAGPSIGSATWGFNIFTSQAQPAAGFAFATNSTRIVKTWVTRFCAGGAHSSCGSNELIEGLYQISGTDGVWAY